MAHISSTFHKITPRCKGGPGSVSSYTVVYLFILQLLIWDFCYLRKKGMMHIHEKTVVSFRDIVCANQSVLCMSPSYWFWYSLSLRNSILSSVIIGRCRKTAFKKVTGYHLKMLTWAMWEITAGTVTPLSCEFLESRCWCLLLIFIFLNLTWFLVYIL